MVAMLAGCDHAVKETTELSAVETPMPQVSPKPELSYVPDMDSPGVLQRTERFLEEYIDAKHTREYRNAVGKVFLTQINFCDGTGKPERTVLSESNSADGKTNISFTSPGRSHEGDVYDNALCLHEGGLIGLDWHMETAIDGCPCMCPEMPRCLDDELLETIAKIKTLEKIDLSGGFISDIGLSKLAPLANLKSLQFSEDRSGYYFPENQPKLTFAAFDSLHALVDLEELVTSRLAQQEDIDSRPLFRALPHYPKLRHFSAIGLTFDRKNMEALVSCENLESLDIEGVMLEPCLDLIERLRKLKTLSLNIRTNGHDIDIPNLPALRSLSLTVSGADEQRIVVKKQLVLENIALSMSTKKNHVVLADLPELSSIRLTQENAHSIDADFDNLPKVVSCKWLPCDSAVPEKRNQPWDEPFRFTENNLEAALHLPALRTLEILGPLEKNVDLKKLESLQSLYEIELRAVEMNDPGFCANLKAKIISLYCCRLPDDFSLDNIPTLSELRMYYCFGRNITIRNAPELQRVVWTPWDYWEEKDEMESFVFEGCPKLSEFSCSTDVLDNLDILDIRGTKIPKKTILDFFPKYNDEGEPRKTKLLTDDSVSDEKGI